jgi:hypothetical protein
MRSPDDCGLGDEWVGNQRAFDLGSADAVPGHIDDVVDPAGDPVIVVSIPAAAVTQ